MSRQHSTTQEIDDFDDEPGMTPAEMLDALRRKMKLLIIAPLLVAALVAVITGLMTPTFTATSTFMPPQQAQGGVASALASLGPLAGLAGLTGGTAGIGASAERYVALMRSVTLSDRMVAKFDLMAVYEAKLKVDARNQLSNRVQIAVGKKDGLIKVSVDDHSPQRAADMANQYIVELYRMTQSLAVTEAQQRRTFFEQQLKLSRDRLVLAQQALQASGFNPGALKAEPRAAVEAYARLKAETTTAEVRLQTLRSSLADGAPEVLKQASTLAALRAQLERQEQAGQGEGGPDYIGKYREFKYQETLFEMYARQFEIARVDESRESNLIQVVDRATPPERKSKPQRAISCLIGLLATLVFLSVLVLLRAYLSRQGSGSFR